MNDDYRVAAHLGANVRRPEDGQIPEGKLHAYVRGANTTACGFGLDRMQRFEELKFSLMNPAARCPQCAAMARAGAH
jgi:hypothetical protein